MWTPTELASEFRGYRGTVWRVVEAQHRISTNRLAGNLSDQARLETLAEAAKPDLPRAAQGLHFLLAAPFRYGHKSASRFRRADERPGIFYASENETTAIAETAYWRLRFYTRSPGFVPPTSTIEHTSFTASVATPRALDLTRPPFAALESTWTDSVEYKTCQDLAGTARAAGAQLLRTISARDPERGCNIVVLSAEAFARRRPGTGRTWHLRFDGTRLVAFAAFPSEEVRTFFAHDFGLDSQF